MPQKTIELPGIGEVLLVKRRGTRNVRLSITAQNKIRLSLPAWAPYRLGIKFVTDRRQWIMANQASPLSSLKNGDRIGKSYRLVFKKLNSPRITSKITGNQVIITSNLDTDDAKVQQKAIKVAEKALRKEAQKLLNIRTAELAKRNDYHYNKLVIKKLTARWGSCSSDKTITLSIYLIQLPWRLIDYVVMHELIHTKYLNHSKRFWTEFEKIMPELRDYKREIKQYNPRIIVA